MKHYLYVAATLFFVCSANASLENPCNTGIDCRNTNAEKIIIEIDSCADRIREISSYISNSGGALSPTEVRGLVVNAQAIWEEADAKYRNFSQILEIEDNRLKMTVSKRYSSLVYRSMLVVNAELYKLKDRVRLIKVGSTTK